MTQRAGLWEQDLCHLAFGGLLRPKVLRHAP